MFVEFQFFDSYEDYMMNYLTQVESESDDVLDKLSHKNKKFLFYQFNQYLVQIGLFIIIIIIIVIIIIIITTVIQEKNGSILLNVCWKEAFKQQMMKRHFLLMVHLRKML